MIFFEICTYLCLLVHTKFLIFITKRYLIGGSPRKIKHKSFLYLHYIYFKNNYATHRLLIVNSNYLLAFRYHYFNVWLATTHS